MTSAIKIQGLLNKIGAIVTLKAKRLVPFDQGHLAASITWRVEGNRVIIFTPLKYAKDMEFGTPPRVLSTSEKKDIEAWAKRKKIPYKAVIKKIETKGIKAGTVESPLLTKGGRYRPFLRPALHQSLPEIKKLIKRELSE